MSTKQPPEIKEKRALLGRDRYFRLLGEKCAGYGVNRDLAYLVYMASIQVIGQELNRHGVVRLPHIGTIAMVEQKARPAWCGKARVHMPARKTLKMHPDYLLKKIYNTKQNDAVSVYRHSRKDISL